MSRIIASDVHSCLIGLAKPNEMAKGGREPSIYTKVTLAFEVLMFNKRFDSIVFRFASSYKMSFPSV
jgi:hypothetical protein